MGRRKIEIKAIKDDRNRSVTFLKRKGGLFKKAHELSVLCSVDVAVFIFGSNKKLYEYSSGDMRELITRYTYHGGPNEHKGPGDYNGGGDDDDDDEGDGTPPLGHEGSVEPQMMPPHFQGQPPFPGHLRHHTPSASPPINGIAYVPRGPTPQPQVLSRPSSRTDFRRAPQPNGPPPPPPQQVANGYAFIPQPAIYNPQNQGNLQAPHPHGLPPPPPSQYQFQSQAQPQHPTQPQPPPHPALQYLEEQRRASAPPPNFTPQPQHQPLPRPQASPPQAPPQQLPAQRVLHPSPPPPPSQHLEPPQHNHQQAQPRHTPEPQPPAPRELKHEHPSERPGQPLLDTASAIKKLPQRKSHSIFTPIDENRSILSQHLASFHAEPLVKDEANRSHSIDVSAISRNSNTASPPNLHRAHTSKLSKVTRNSVSSIPETTFTPPSRSNSMKVGSATRPRLKVQIPDEASDAGSNAAESGTSPRGTTTAVEITSATPRRNGEGHGPVLPPPSPSAQTLLSAGATGPPNPFARPPPQSQNNMNIDTPVSALPSRFMNNEFLPSPSSFYPGWDFRGNDSNTLPSPLNFATPVAPSGPSFLRDDNGLGATKRKSPDMTNGGHTSDGLEGGEPKRIKVDG